MNIIFKTIRIHNFLSIGDAELNLNNSGYSIIAGINNNSNDNAKSNGSGKSSIGEAITWVLTGSTIRNGSKDIRNIHTSDGAYVILEFSIDDIEYKIIRSKEHVDYKTDLKIYINGEDKSGKGIRDSEKLLAQPGWGGSCSFKQNMWALSGALSCERRYSSERAAAEDWRVSPPSFYCGKNGLL